MQLTLEKVLVLKNVPLFAGIPESTLSEIIAASEETAAMIGTDIVKEGDMWNELYIILQGQVRLHKQGQTVQEHSALEFFGELSALDPAPADITVTALDDTIMFKLPGSALYRLMNEHKSLERSIITTLCRRIRKMRKEMFDCGMTNGNEKSLTG